MGFAMMFALFVGGFASFWAALHLQYGAGINVMTAHNWGQFQQLKSWQQFAGPGRISGVRSGWDRRRLAALGMMWMRTRFLWWPFHPGGLRDLPYFRRASTTGRCLMIARSSNTCVLRYGGYG